MEVTGLRRTDDPYLQMSTSNNVLCNHSEHMEALVTDDLVKRLRDGWTEDGICEDFDEDVLLIAADRIEELEDALQRIAKANNSRDRYSPVIDVIVIWALKKDSE